MAAAPNLSLNPAASPAALTRPSARGRSAWFVRPQAVSLAKQVTDEVCS